MKTFLFGIYLWSVVLVLCSNANDVNNNEQIQIELRPRIITKNNFDETIHEPLAGTFIMYHAPWCGHCKRMLTTWTELAQRHNHQKRFLIGKVDCTTETDFCSDNDILGYPTFIFYKKTKEDAVRYDGQRDLETMELFMFNNINSEKIAETSSQVSENNVDVQSLTDSEFEKFISNDFHFVKFFAPWCGHCQKMAQAWKDLALKYSKTNVKISEVDCTQQSSLCQMQEVKGYPTIIFYHNGKKIETYTGQRNIESFTIFIDDKKSKLSLTNDESLLVDKVIKLTSENYLTTLEKSEFTFVKYFAPWCGHCRTMADAWIELAEKMHQKANIAEVDCTINEEICNSNNINGYPTLILYKNGKKIDEHTGTRDLDGLFNFLNGHLKHDEL